MTPQQHNTAPTDVLCKNRGDHLRNQKCEVCAGNVEIKVFECVEHGECTLGKKIAGIACCNDNGCLCEERVDPKVESPPEPTEVKTLNLRFVHGLGDCVHFALMTQLWRQVGYAIAIQGEPTKEFLWKVAGLGFSNIRDIPSSAALWPEHRWDYPVDFDQLQHPDLQKNKIAGNLNAPPLPRLAPRSGLWRKLANTVIDARPFISERVRGNAADFLSDLPKPIVLIHNDGAAWRDRKTLPQETMDTLQLDLAGIGSVVLLDWHGNVKKIEHANIRTIREWDEQCDLEHMAALMEKADLMIGIDSGPLHFARLFPNLKILGVWRSVKTLHPNRCTIPAPNQRNLVGSQYYYEWQRDDREAVWDFTYYDGLEPTAQDIFCAAREFLEDKPANPEPPYSPVGRYLYRRVGHDQRPIEILPDGTIGRGAAGCEKVWRVTRDGQLLVFGDCNQKSATFRCDRKDDGTFVGKWLFAEQMPVELVPWVDDKKVMPPIQADVVTSSTAKKIVLHNGLSAGDILVLTMAIESLHIQYPGEYLTDVDSPCPDIFVNNPRITKLDRAAPGVQFIDMHYPAINESNERNVHFGQAFCEYLGRQLGVPLSLKVNRPSLYFGQDETSWMSRVEEVYGRKVKHWLINIGWKNDYPAKAWVPERAQRVIDHFRGKILFVQVGLADHVHPPLKNVLNQVGKTSLREFLRLCMTAEGGIGGVTLMQHAFAALEKPYICIAGGREPPSFTHYNTQTTLHTIGALDCCRRGGCWKSRVVPLNDGDSKDNELCVQRVPHGDTMVQRCMDLISEDEVIGAIERYYHGGVLSY